MSMKNVKTDFGAVGDGIHDDTDAIQKAYDSLMYSQGFPILHGFSIGGCVYFPAGSYKITRPILVRGCVVTKGDGLASSIIKCDSGLGAFRLIGSSGIQVNDQTLFEDIGIYTKEGCGIFTKLDSKVQPELIVASIRCNRVSFNTADWAINLTPPDCYCQDSRFTFCDFRNLGRGMMNIDGNYNSLFNCNGSGGVRQDWQGNIPAFITVRGTMNSVEQCRTEFAPNGIAKGFYYGPSKQAFGGTYTSLIRHINNWIENTCDKDGYCIEFDDVSQATVNYLPLYTGCKAKITNSHVVLTDHICGNALRDVIDIDNQSTLLIENQRSSYFNHPNFGDNNISVLRSINPRTNKVIQPYGMDASANLWENPGFFKGLEGISITDAKNAKITLTLEEGTKAGKTLLINISNYDKDKGYLTLAIKGAVRPAGTGTDPISGFWRYTIDYDDGIYPAMYANAITETEEERDHKGIHIVPTNDITQTAYILLNGNGNVRISNIEAYAGNTSSVVRHPPMQAIRVWPNGAVEFQGTSAPSTGTYKKGSRIINSDPKPGGYIGWVCITEGTPGKWKQYGYIRK